MIKMDYPTTTKLTIKIEERGITVVQNSLKRDTSNTCIRFDVHTNVRMVHWYNDIKPRQH